VASVNPAPVDDLAALLARFHLALTVEAHYVIGAVGSLVSEVVAERGLGCRVVRCGVRTTPGATTGSQGYLHHSHGLSSDALVQTALRVGGAKSPDIQFRVDQSFPLQSGRPCQQRRSRIRGSQANSESPRIYPGREWLPR
jgi:hypothetical protein